MLVLILFLVSALSVPFFNGRFGRLVDLRLAWTPALLVAVGLQGVMFGLRADDPAVLGLLHVASYFFAGAFLIVNRRVPGLWLIGLGGLCNLLVITANGGVMPALPGAYEAAGLAPHAAFSNSMVVEHARLAFLGDVFAIPAYLPFSNVFSIGDVLLVVGGFVALHRLSGSRLIPSGTGQFTELRQHRGFMRLWGAQGVSNLGDWTYSLAVAASVADRTDAAHIFATLLIAQVAPAALAGLLGGPLIDRLPRVRLMVSTDLVRALAVGSLVFTGIGSLVHLYLVAAVLGLSGALFQPAMQASLPNLLPREKIVAGNSLVAGTHHLAIMLGPVLGGVLVASIGAGPAFGVNAATFILSALLVMGIKLPRRVVTEGEQNPRAALVEGLRYSIANPLVRGVLITLSVVVFAAALRSPLEPLFILNVLGREATALGLVGGAWGLGMLLGSLAAPAAARRWPRERMLWISIMAVGFAVLLASRSEVLSPVLMFWLFAGCGNAVGTICYESMLQERTPDALRGRVMAATEAVVQSAFLAGAAVAGVVAAAFGVRGAYVISGCLFLVAAVISRIVLPVRRPPAAVVVEAPGHFGPDAAWRSPSTAPAGAESPVRRAAELADLPGLPGSLDGGSVLVLVQDRALARQVCDTLEAAQVPFDRIGGLRDLEVALRHLPLPRAIVLDPAFNGGQGAAVLRTIRVSRQWEGAPVVAIGPLVGADAHTSPEAAPYELLTRLSELRPPARIARTAPPET